MHTENAWTQTRRQRFGVAGKKREKDERERKKREKEERENTREWETRV